MRWDGRWRMGWMPAALLVACGGDDDGGITAAATGEAARVAAMAPAPGNDYVAADQDLAVAFTEPMDRSSVEAAYSVDMSDGGVGGDFSWSDGHRAMAFRPDAPLPGGQQVRVTWGEGMHGADGRPVGGEDGEPLAPFEFACTVYAAPRGFDSAGERIYFAGTSPSGQDITFAMGDDFDGAGMPGYGTSGMGRAGMGMMGGRMGMGGGSTTGRHYGMACVSCHGPDGEGGRYLTMGAVRAPSIRYAVLTGQEEAHEDGTGEGGHAPYDDEGIARAIARGLDMEGEALSGFMPRWTMSSADLVALVEYLKTL